MVGVGRISLLIDSPLRTVNLAFRGLDADVRKQITARLKPVATAAWREETSGHALSRLQQRVLAGTSRVLGSGLDLQLAAGHGATLSTGTRTGRLSRAVAFGANPAKQWPARSRRGKTYQRRMGNKFPLPRGRGGHVVYPAARAAIPRIASLIVQTTIRTVHETIEGFR